MKRFDKKLKNKAAKFLFTFVTRTLYNIKRENQFDFPLMILLICPSRLWEEGEVPSPSVLRPLPILIPVIRFDGAFSLRYVRTHNVAYYLTRRHFFLFIFSPPFFFLPAPLRPKTDTSSPGGVGLPSKKHASSSFKSRT